MKHHHNHVELIGRLHGDLHSYSIEATGEMFFNGTIAVLRTSGVFDYLPINIPAWLVDGNAEKAFALHGRCLRLIGEIRTHNKLTEGKSRHYTVMYVKEIKEENQATNDNNVELEGVICRPPVYRETPFGREICDFMIAINRSCNRSAYIPCIAWGMTARKVSALEVGTMVTMHGRFQSREYTKQLQNGQQETRTTHEVSCKYVNVVKQEEAEA